MTTPESIKDADLRYRADLDRIAEAGALVAGLPAERIAVMVAATRDHLDAEARLTQSLRKDLAAKDVELAAARVHVNLYRHNHNLAQDDARHAERAARDARAEVDRLRVKLSEALNLLDVVHDDNPCSLDHNGNCHAHAWFPFDRSEECPESRIARTLAAIAVSSADQPEQAQPREPRVWRKGDPMPPHGVDLLQDEDDGILRFLERVAADLWRWRSEDGATTGEPGTWTKRSQPSLGPLTEVVPPTQGGA